MATTSSNYCPVDNIRPIHASAPLRDDVEIGDNMSLLSRGDSSYFWLIMALHGVALMFIGSLYYANLQNFVQEEENVFGYYIVWRNLAIAAIVVGTLLTFICQLYLLGVHLRHNWTLVYYIFSSVVTAIISMWLITTEAYTVQHKRISRAATELIIVTGMKPIVFIVFVIKNCVVKWRGGDDSHQMRQNSHFNELKYVCEYLERPFKCLIVSIIVLSTPFLIIWLTVDPITREMICPTDVKRIYPCSCDSLWGEVRCEGSEVTQDSINQFFMAFRQINNIASSSDRLNIASFYIVGTKLVKLDLSYFSSISFTHTLSVTNNPNLTTILNSTTNPKTRIVATSYVDLSNNNLDDHGISSLFHLFAPTLKSIYLNGNNIQGPSSSSSEFIPGLSLHIQLEELNLDNNNIGSIGSGQFKKNKWLRKLQLSSNRIHDIGPMAFTFDPPDPDMLHSFLSIDLRNNYLSDSVINPASFNSIGRPTKFYFDRNQFKYISESNFFNLIFSYNTNYISFFGNTFVCDEKMKWLKNRKSQLEARLIGIECSNEPEKTVFSMDLKSMSKINIGSWCLIIVSHILVLLANYM